MTPNPELYNLLIKNGASEIEAFRMSGYRPEKPAKDSASASYEAAAKAALAPKPTVAQASAAVTPLPSKPVSVASAATTPKKAPVVPPTPAPETLMSSAPVVTSAPVVQPAMDSASASYQAAGKAALPDSFEANATALGDSVMQDHQGFALYLRDLADKGQLKDSSGKPLPMYSREKIASLDLPTLQKLVSNNPTFANQYFGKPTTPPEELKGTSRTEVGKSGQVIIPPVEQVEVKPVVKQEQAVKVATVQSLESKITEGTATPKEEKTFKDMLRDLSKNFGISALEILQAGAYGYTGNQKELAYEKREGREKEEKDRLYQEKIEAEKKAYEEKVNKQERDFQAEQAKIERDARAAEAELNRIAQKQMLGQQLTADEKVASIRLAAEKAARAQTVQSYVGGL